MHQCFLSLLICCDQVVKASSLSSFLNHIFRRNGNIIGCTTLLNFCIHSFIRIKGFVIDFITCFSFKFLNQGRIYIVPNCKWSRYLLLPCHLLSPIGARQNKMTIIAIIPIKVTVIFHFNLATSLCSRRIFFKRFGVLSLLIK